MRWKKNFHDYHLEFGDYHCAVYGEEDEWHGFVEDISTGSLKKINPKKNKQTAQRAVLREARSKVQKDLVKLKNYLEKLEGKIDG